MGELVRILEEDPDSWNEVLMMLSVLKSGLRAPSNEVQLWTLKTLGFYLTELNLKGNCKSVWDWFVSEEGLWNDLLIVTGPKFNNLNVESLNLLLQCSWDNLHQVLHEMLSNEFPEYVDYVQAVTNLLSIFKELSYGFEKLRNLGLIEQWIEIAIEKAQHENPESTERAEALKFLANIWIDFPHFVELQGETVIKLLQRTARDKNMNLQLCALALMFRLAEVFILLKNKFGGMIYKSLAFALIENYKNEEVREFILMNFIEFIQIEGVPLQILLFPYIKHLQISEGATLCFNTYDFGFIQALAKHPKLPLGNAVQLLEILGRVYIHSSLFASSAMHPFLVLSSRFNEFKMCLEYLVKYLKKLVDIFTSNAQREISCRSHPAAKKRTQNNTIIRAQNCRVIEISTILFKTFHKVKEILREKDERLLDVLKHIMDPDYKIQDFISFVNIQKQNELEEIKIRSAKNEGRKFKHRPIGNKTMDGRNNVQTNETSDYSNTSYDYSVPESSKGSTSFIKRKRTSIDSRQNGTEKMRLIKEKSQSPTHLLILPEGTAKLSLPSGNDTHIELFDLQSEEQKEIDAMLMFNEEHAPVFKSLFQKYSNTLSHKKSLQKITKQKSSQISLEEICKLLKDHSISCKMITQEKVSEFIGLINSKLGKHGEKGSINFEGFFELFLQLGIYIFSQDPIVSSSPPVCQVKMLLDIMGNSAKANGEAMEMFSTNCLYSIEKVVEKNYKGHANKKLIQRKKIVDRFYIQDSLSLPESLRISIEILDTIVGSLFQTHFVEPISSWDGVLRVVDECGRNPPPPKSLQETHKRQESLPLKPNILPQTEIQIPNAIPIELNLTSQIKKDIFEPKIRHSIIIQPPPKPEEKFQPVYTKNMLRILLKASKTEKPIVKEVVDILGEIIAVVEKKKVLKNTTNPTRIIIPNTPMVQFQPKMNENRQVLQKKRESTINNIIIELKKAKNENTQNDSEQFLPDIPIPRQNANAKKNTIAIKKRLTEEEHQRAHVAEEFGKQRSQLDKLNEELKVIEKHHRFPRSKTIGRRQKEITKTETSNISRMREENDVYGKISPIREENYVYGKLSAKKHNIQRRLEQDRKKRIEQDHHIKILQEFMGSEDIQYVFIKYLKPIHFIFQHYSKQHESIAPTPHPAPTMDMQDCLKLLFDFRIIPHLISSEEGVIFFRQSISLLPISGVDLKGRQNFDENGFKTFLVQLSLLLKNKINDEGRRVLMAPLNPFCEVDDADAFVLINLLSYMRISPEDKSVDIGSKMRELSEVKANLAHRSITPYRANVKHTLSSNFSMDYGITNPVYQ